MDRDVMLGSLKLHLSANRTGVAVSYYDQDYQHQGGLQRVRIGHLTPDDLRNGGLDAVIDVTSILPAAIDLFRESGGVLDEGAA